MDGTWHTATAETDAAGIRVDKWLAGWTELSRARIGALIDARQVRADGDIITKPTNKVREGVEYAVFVPPPVDDTPKPENIPLDILYEDDQLIVVNKPAGMTVHPAPGSRSATLVNALLYHCADSLSGIGGVMRPGIVHRIDKDTSGALVVAKTDKAHRYLSKQFAKHTVERVYVCLARSVPKPREGQIISRIARSVHDRKKQAVVRGTMNNIEASDHGRHAARPCGLPAIRRSFIRQTTSFPDEQKSGRACSKSGNGEFQTPSASRSKPRFQASCKQRIHEL